MIVADAGFRWTVIHLEIGDPVVRQYRVLGGFLYQVSKENASPQEADNKRFGDLTWYPPLFVPSESA